MTKTGWKLHASGRFFVAGWAIGPVTKIWYLHRMSKNTSIALGAPFQEFARRKVESGEYGSTSEVVREAMRRFMTDDLKLQALRAAIQEGLDSGPAEPFSFDEFISEMQDSAKDADAA